MKKILNTKLLFLFVMFSTNLAMSQSTPGQTTTTATTPAATSPSIEQKISKLEERLMELEAQSSLTKYRLSGVFINRFENLTYEHGLPGADKAKEILRPMSMYFGLNVDFDVTKNLKFYSTLAMAKFYNNEDRNESLDPNSTSGYATYQATEAGSWAYSGSGMKVDRAYLSYEPADMPMTIAFGRMPTNNGPPLNQMDGLPRQGTYPRFVFNAIFDGIALVYDLNKYLPKNNTFKLRAFYQPFTFIDRADRTRQFVDGDLIESHVNQYALLAEYAIHNTPVAERIDLMYMRAAWKNFYVGYNGSTSSAGTAMAGQTEDGSDDGFYLGLENIASLGLNFSWSALLYKAVDSGLPDVNKEAWGHLVNINENFGNGWILGYEYIKTAKYFYLDEWTRLNLMPFYSLQSAEGHHVFMGFPLPEKMMGRIGHYRVTAGEGDVFQPEEQQGSSFYAQVRVNF